MATTNAIRVGELVEALRGVSEDSVIVLVDENWQDVGLLTQIVDGTTSGELADGVLYLAPVCFDASTVRASRQGR